MKNSISYGAWTTLYYLFGLNAERKRIESLENIIDLCEEYKTVCRESTTSGANELFEYGVEVEEYIKKCIKNHISYNSLKREANVYGAPVSEKEL